MRSTPAGNLGARAWSVMTGVLVIEVLGGLALLWSVTQAFLGAADEPLGQLLSVLLSAIVAFAWVAITCVGALRSRAGWVRGSAIALHVLMFAAGTGVLQGILGDPLLGWVLVALALIGFFSALAARTESPDAEPRA